MGEGDTAHTVNHRKSSREVFRATCEDYN